MKAASIAVKVLTMGALALLACTEAPSTATPQGQRTATSPGPNSVMRMRLVKSMDAQGWGQPVEAARLLVPTDWEVEGGVNWVRE